MAKPTELFGKNLKDALGERSQGWLAKEADTTSAMISDYINGKTFPNLKTAERIADALGLSVADLIGDDPPPSPPEPKIEQMKLTAISRIIRLTREEDVQGIIEFLDTFLDRSTKKNQRRTAGP